MARTSAAPCMGLKARQTVGQRLHVDPSACRTHTQGRANLNVMLRAIRVNFHFAGFDFQRIRRLYSGQGSAVVLQGWPMAQRRERGEAAAAVGGWVRVGVGVNDVSCSDKNGSKLCTYSAYSIGKLRWIFASPTPTLIQCPGQPCHPAQQAIASASSCRGIDLGRMATGTELCVHPYINIKGSSPSLSHLEHRTDPRQPRLDPDITYCALLQLSLYGLRRLQLASLIDDSTSLHTQPQTAKHESPFPVHRARVPLLPAVTYLNCEKYQVCLCSTNSPWSAPLATSRSRPRIQRRLHLHDSMRTQKAQTTLRK